MRRRYSAGLLAWSHHCAEFDKSEELPKQGACAVAVRDACNGRGPMVLRRTGRTGVAPLFCRVGKEAAGRVGKEAAGIDEGVVPGGASGSSYSLTTPVPTPHTPPVMVLVLKHLEMSLHFSP